MSDDIQTPVEKQAPEHHNPGRLGRNIGLAVVVIATALAAIVSGFYNRDAHDTLDNVETKQVALDKDQEDFDKQIACQQIFLEQQSIALKARSNFAEEQARVTLRSLRAQLSFLEELAAGSTGGQSTDPLALYLDALRDNITAIRDQLRVRENVPYPNQDDIEVCADPDNLNEDGELVPGKPAATDASE